MLTITTKHATTEGIRTGFTLELTRDSLFISLPGVGELWVRWFGGREWVWSPA